MYIKTARQLAAFIKQPSAPSEKTLSISDKIKTTWAVFLIKLVITVIISVLVGLFYDPVNKTASRHASQFTPGMMVLVGVLILPFLEEVAFRLSLKFKPLYLALSTSVMVYYITSKMVFQTQLSNVQDHFNIRLLLAVSSLVVSFMVYNHPAIRRQLEHLWQNQLPRVVYFYCVVFAFMHTFNYELSYWTVVLLPLILLPKFWSAFCYSYVRLNLGFAYSVGMHLLWNGVSVVISLNI